MERIHNKIAFGGDYNPEQWDEEIRKQDMILLPEAGVDIVSINIFSWTLIQPDEETYDFTELDKIVDMVTEKGMKICMATSTGAHPAWMAKKYPDILRVDNKGIRRKFGQRHNSCPNSPTFRKFSPLLAGKIAEHYKDNKNIVMWHISNEYGGECYCENCEKAFRVWLKDRYGSLDGVNYAWNTNFWSHTYTDWEQIELPSLLTEMWDSPDMRTAHPGIKIDYARFNSDGMMQNFIDEREAIRKYIPDAKVTTNFMMMFGGLDYHKWAKEMDAISWDSYPQRYTDAEYVALNHDLMRGMKHGESFMLMEQSPTCSSYLPINTIKRPGIMRLLSYQAVAHGADTIMYFQMRQSPASCEMLHGAIIDHVGTNETRSYKECAALGAELKALGDITLGGKAPAKAGIIFDWDCRWAIENTAGISYDFSYCDEIYRYYKAFHNLNIPVDIIPMDEELDSYDLILAPAMYMEKFNIADRLKKFASSGKTVLLSVMSGIVTEDDRAILGGFPGNMMDLTGVWAEEMDMLLDTEENNFEFEGNQFKAKIICNVLRSKGAESLADYETDYYKGLPAITCNSYEGGKVYYVGCSSTDEFYREMVAYVCKKAGVTNVLGRIPNADEFDPDNKLEITRRVNDNDILYVLNHNTHPVEFTCTDDRTDILTGTKYKAGEVVNLMPADVLFLKI